MLTEQMKDDLRKVTWKWKKPAIPFFTRLRLRRCLGIGGSSYRDL
jgi:hypothetical protein